MQEVICEKCGLRFLLGTLTGKARAEAHFSGGCEAPIPEPPTPIRLAKEPQSQAVKYPGRKGKGGKGY